MINQNCYFLRAQHCAILTHTRCPGCKFYKTGLEYMADREHAQRILDAKGLEAFREGNVITTRKRKEDVHDSRTT